ncbi:DNA alkylation repair protein [Patescibacteria group bacterium]|nr:DNA alkylation repair protein [Patescibacteria group bacterium]MBU1721554.1 DNA alkylation repair protein [Patescibacteria group bacterium]MBU1901468.1 DNA alkylation repair protein [Patescibacteria group bacterium]
MTAVQVQRELNRYANPVRKKTNEWFFKTGKGEYGEGDVFLGIRVPDIRKVSKQFYSISRAETKKLLQSPYHEERLAALLILVNQFQKGDDVTQKSIFDFYIRHTKYVNNWDLVDLSAHYIVGAYMLKHPNEETILDSFVCSKSLWERRIAMVATWIFIREGKFDKTIELAEILLDDKEDLMHKASGWMLREVWKKKNAPVEDFIKKHYTRMPRTMLRYAIEKMDEIKRKQFLKGNF